MNDAVPQHDSHDGEMHCAAVALGYCAAGVDGYCIGGTKEGMCHG